jgi:hypothetical protein
MDDLDEKVLTIQQRQKRAQIMRRIQPKVERAREIAQKRMAPEASIRKRAFIQARQLVRRRVAGERGAEYEKLGPSEKMAIDRAVEGKQKIIKAIALRLIPRVKRAEAIRLSSFMKGQTLQNQGQPEGKSKESSGSSSVKENLNALFSEAFPEADTDTVNMKAGTKFASKDKKIDAKDKSKNSAIIQYSKFQEEVDYVTPAFTSLCKKSEKSGIDLDVLGEVYNRGWNTWTEGCSVSQQQYAFARVNSFINQGKTYFNEDSDLQELSKGKIADYLDKSQSGRQHPTPEKFRRSAKMATIAAKKSGKRFPGSGRVSVKVKATNEETLDEMRNVPLHKLQRIVNRGESDPDGVGPAFGMSIIAARKEILRRKKLGLKEARGPGKPSITRYKRPDGTTALKSLNKWGKRKDWQDTEGGLKKAREHSKSDLSEVQHTNENFIDGKGPGKPGDASRHGLKGKSATELRKIRSSETASPRKKQLAHWMLNMHHNEETELDEKRGLWDNIRAKRKRIKSGSGERMRKPGSDGAPTKQNFRDASESIEQDTGNGTRLVDKQSTNSKVRKKIEAVDRALPHTEHGKQAQIQKKIIDEEGNSQPDPKKRLIGTDTLVKALKKDTPGEGKNIDESFSIAFASGVGITLTAGDLGMRAQGGFELHPSVIKQMEDMEEEVRSADTKGVVVRTADGETIIRKQKVNRKIIGTGNLNDGKPDDTV